MTKLLHNWDFWGWVGTTSAVILPFLKSSLPVLQWIGACCGIVLAVYSIGNKRLERKKLKDK